MNINIYNKINLYSKNFPSQIIYLYCLLIFLEKNHHEFIEYLNNYITNILFISRQ